MAAIGSTQTVPLVAPSPYCWASTEPILITDGTHTVDGHVTAAGSCTSITVQTDYIEAGSSGNTMGSAATVIPWSRGIIADGSGTLLDINGSFFQRRYDGVLYALDE